MGSCNKDIITKIIYYKDVIKLQVKFKLQTCYRIEITDHRVTTLWKTVSPSTLLKHTKLHWECRG